MTHYSPSDFCFFFFCVSLDFPWNLLIFFANLYWMFSVSFYSTNERDEIQIENLFSFSSESIFIVLAKHQICVACACIWLIKFWILSFCLSLNVCSFRTHENWFKFNYFFPFFSYSEPRKLLQFFLNFLVLSLKSELFVSRNVVSWWPCQSKKKIQRKNRFCQNRKPAYTGYTLWTEKREHNESRMMAIDWIDHTFLLRIAFYHFFFLDNFSHFLFYRPFFFGWECAILHRFRRHRRPDDTMNSTTTLKITHNFRTTKVSWFRFVRRKWHQNDTRSFSFALNPFFFHFSKKLPVFL